MGMDKVSNKRLTRTLGGFIIIGSKIRGDLAGWLAAT